MQTLQARLKDLAEANDSDSGSTITLEALEELRDVHDSAAKARRSWQQDLERAQAIVRTATREEPAVEIAAAQPAEQNQAAPLATPQPTLAEKMEQAKDEEIIAELDHQREREQEQKRLARIAAEKAAAEQARLEKKAQSSEVTTALSIFLQPRYVQPKLSGAAVRFEETIDKMPMSFSRLNTGETSYRNDVNRFRLD